MAISRANLKTNTIEDNNDLPNNDTATKVLIAKIDNRFKLTRLLE
jgi:hypothetical protein